jgi:hypothetical protein
MYKCLTVVAFVLLVLSGAMGLRNVAASSAVTSPASTPAIWAIGGGVPPAPYIGGGVPPAPVVLGIGGGVPPAPFIGGGVPPAPVVLGIGGGVPPLAPGTGK